MMREFLYFLRAVLRVIFSPLLALWYVQYWFKSHNKHFSKHDYKQPTLVGFTDKMFYEPADNVKLFLSSETRQSCQVKVFQIIAHKKEELQNEFVLQVDNQKSDNDSIEQGCDWQCNYELKLENYKQGYYKIYLNDSFAITFIVGSGKVDSSICVVAPVSTWVAYNHFGGKSAYDNYWENKTVHFLSTHRPNLALEYNDVENIHDMNIEANIFNWLNENYEVTIIPDYALEYKKIDSEIVVLSYHCEYFSSKMYQGLKKLLQKSSIINLGANHIYWKVKWNADYTQLEVRKDMTFFKSSLKVGGMWRHALSPENQLLNASYTDAGIGTFAPYKVLKPDHWLFEGLDLSKGDVFGEKGLNYLGICGDETDKCSLLSAIDVEVIARGMNCNDGELYENYDANNHKWNGEGGGDLSVRLTKDKTAVLNTSSIQSGSGLGTDEVFTTVIQNFIRKFTS